jgi:hypothetical protein
MGAEACVVQDDPAGYMLLCRQAAYLQAQLAQTESRMSKFEKFNPLTANLFRKQAGLPLLEPSE